eukprot:TRINITY_DN3736_c0_g1_i1.p1 TRINITY_DN3736_c0_g1~~TRINITY_DN3736_c0_g1_i1.p1  ORF type:complete len:789 (-),score=169.87 TRINITY_DN3736_c0_g1_i1:1170-3536(-)
MRAFIVLVACVAVAFAASCTHKVDCGYSGISQSECASRGCCWDSSRPDIWCSAPACTDSNSCSNHGACVSGVCQCSSGWEGFNCADTEITTVHVIQACHLDVGFADSAIGIINRYFDHHFPMIAEVGEELRKTSSHRLRFMTQSYLVSLYLDCPPSMGIHCPNDTARAAFLGALQNGDATYHAFPFNAEPELYSPLTVVAGVELTHILDKQLGMQPKATMSQRDVPGMTRGMINVLRDSDVTAISVGVNGASTPPDVPKIFVWRDDLQEVDILAMWHPFGYGGYSRAEAVTVPGCSHALVFDWNGDNAGPYTAAEYIQHFEAIQQEFPKANVYASTFDNFTSIVEAYRDKLPVISGDIGDTWIYGCPSDAKKVAMMRAMDRAWDEFVGFDRMELRERMQSDAVFLNATRLMIKNGEHTWGRDVKSNLQDNAHWANRDFEWARTIGPNRTQYGILEDSWWEQRWLGIDVAMEALQAAGHPLFRRVMEEFSMLQPEVPEPEAEGYVRAKPNTEYSCAGLRVQFDESTGAISSLVQERSGQQWASVQHQLGVLDYRTYSQEDINDFLNEYLAVQPPPSWAFHDFGKPNCTESEHLRYVGELQSLWYREDQRGGGCSFLVESAFGGQASTAYGAPRVIWTRWRMMPDRGENSFISMDVQAFNKTSTRLPEAMFVTFNPTHSDPYWHLFSLGDTINMTDTLNGGSKHMRAVDMVSFVESLFIDFVDANVVSWGEPNGYPTPTNATANWQDWGVSSMLFNNLWGTNYVMWQPFNKNYAPVAGEENYLFRYEMRV